MNRAKVTAAQLVVDRERARKDKLIRRRVTRELVKALRVMAEMLESGEITEWSVDRNFGYVPLYGRNNFPICQARSGQDELIIKFRYSLARFAKRLRRRKR